MKYLVIEDEIPAQRLIVDLVGELRADWEVVGCLDSVEAAVEWFGGHDQPDVVFLDIQLSDGLSFEILERVDVEGMIIFTTAYDEYAMRAFRVNSIDYLLKPIKKNRLSDALDKYEHYTRKMFRERNRAIDVAELMDALKGAASKYRTRFLVSQGDVFFPLPVERVAYIFSRNKVVSAVTFEGKRYVLDFTLEALEEQLSPEMFFRASRQFIVNVDAVLKVHTFFNGKLLLETKPGFDEKVTISRSKAPQFKLWLDR